MTAEAGQQHGEYGIPGLPRPREREKGDVEQQRPDQEDDKRCPGRTGPELN